MRKALRILGDINMYIEECPRMRGLETEENILMK